MTRLVSGTGCNVSYSRYSCTLGRHDPWLFPPGHWWMLKASLRTARAARPDGGDHRLSPVFPRRSARLQSASFASVFATLPADTSSFLPVASCIMVNPPSIITPSRSLPPSVTPSSSVANATTSCGASTRCIPDGAAASVQNGASAVPSVALLNSRGSSYR